MEAHPLMVVFERLLRGLEQEREIVLNSLPSYLWPPRGIEALETMGLLEPAGYSASMICEECEDECEIEPEPSTEEGEEARVEIACLKFRQYIDFPMSALLRRRFSTDRLAHWLSVQLRLVGGPQRLTPCLWALGDRVGKGTRQSVYFSWRADGGAIPPAQLEQVRNEKAFALVPLRAGPTAQFWAAHGVTTLPLDGYVEVVGDCLRLSPEAGHLVADRRDTPHLPRTTLPAGSSWDHVSIRILEEHEAEVKVDGRTFRLSFIDFGLIDGRKTPPEPSLPWYLLERLAAMGGRIKPGQDSRFVRLRKTVEGLRRALQATLNISDDPFTSVRSTGTWKALFHLTDSRERDVA